MHSARPTGWTGEIPPPADPGSSAAVSPSGGRHHREPAGPPAGEPPPPPPEAPPWSLVPAETDPLVDTDPTGGLSKFDLGMVPASVTPPRTWRHAAWFAVAASAATLGGLVFATTALVGSSTSFQVIDLPSMPRGGEYPPLPSDPYVRSTQPEPPNDSRSEATTPDTGGVPGVGDPELGGNRPSPGGPAPIRRPSPPPTPAPGSGDGQADGQQPGHSSGQPGEDGGTPGDDGRPPSGTAPPSSRPPASKEPAFAGLVAGIPDPEQLRQRTTDYFAAVSAGDLRAAYEMTTGALREEGFAAFAARYADAASIDVVDSSVEWGHTITTLRITRENGTQLTQRRRLEFTSGDDPRIEADELVS